MARLRNVSPSSVWTPRHTGKGFTAKSLATTDERPTVARSSYVDPRVVDL
jgi:hypothetical protein